MHNPAKMNDTPKWLEKLARVGFATKGTLYAIIGVLALMTAIGEGGQTGGSSDAIQKIAQQPFGKALLVLTAIGLFVGLKQVRPDFHARQAIERVIRLALATAALMSIVTTVGILLSIVSEAIRFF